MDHRESSGEGSWAAKVGALSLTSPGHQKEMRHHGLECFYSVPFLFLRFHCFRFLDLMSPLMMGYSCLVELAWTGSDTQHLICWHNPEPDLGLTLLIFPGTGNGDQVFPFCPLDLQR